MSDYKYGSHVVTPDSEDSFGYVTSCSDGVCHVKQRYQRGRPSVYDADSLREAGRREADDVREVIKSAGGLADAVAGLTGVDTCDLVSAGAEYLGEQVGQWNYERHQRIAKESTGFPE